MEVFIIFLVVLAVVISVIPTEEDKKQANNSFRSQFHCENTHTWVIKEVKELDTTYTVCSKCRFLAGTDGDYEA